MCAWEGPCCCACVQMHVYFTICHYMQFMFMLHVYFVHIHKLDYLKMQHFMLSLNMNHLEHVIYTVNALLQNSIYYFMFAANMILAASAHTCTNSTVCRSDLTLQYIHVA